MKSRIVKHMGEEQSDESLTERSVARFSEQSDESLMLNMKIFYV